MLSGEEAKDEDLGLARAILIWAPVMITMIAVIVFVIYSLAA